jgi:hypothetical protein
MTRVTPELRRFVLERDGCCILLRLYPTHRCRDIWGEYHDPRDLDRLTIEHVKDAPMMGKRAPSDPAHMVALCGYANVAVPSKGDRRAMRAYLATVS